MNKSDRRQQVVLCIAFSLVCALIIIPFILVVSISLSSESDILNYGYRLFPKKVDLSAYKFVFASPGSIFQAYKVTIIFSIASMVLGVTLKSMLAFTLSRKGLKGRQVMSFYLYFTMLFSGGLVPTYILISQYLHLTDTIWVYMLVGLVSPWHVFMLRTFFQGIPDEINDAAIIDGASEYRIFAQLYVPMSKPAIATIALFMFLGKWNDWNTAMLYINDESLVSLQYLLQRIMQNIQLIESDPAVAAMYDGEIPAETVRMAMAVIVAGPALVVFPFFQKYFVKGITVGAVKG